VSQPAIKPGEWLSCAGDDLEGFVEQQLWGDATNAEPDTNSSAASRSGGSTGLAAGAADDKGVATWEVNMRCLKTAAYDLGRLPNEVC
jgi:hypothetical protein